MDYSAHIWHFLGLRCKSELFFSDKDSCSGDSGGPLFATESIISYQIGLVSYGTNICGRGIPGVYTKVAAYLPWIESKMEV